MKEKKYKLIIFDADETLRFCTVAGQPCPNKPGEWALLPQVKKVLSKYNWGNPREGKTGYGIASNQGGVELGYFSLETAESLAYDMFIEAFGFSPMKEAILICPYLYHDETNCRKPKGSMLQKIMDFWQVTPPDTLFVGDMPTDRESAVNAGCDFLWAKDFFQ
ncbi:MAG TPA: HAD-IIIA family hydrolase [Candidatus Cloacimonadota bacterium]|nr:HAD-IIIA family hydrolase [Candidatus Cloacimonadota bacterium]